MTGPCMTQSQFRGRFFELTGHHPLSWQSRLYEEWTTGHLRPVIDLPTGLGKTMVMAIWLIARSDGARVPVRLVYVVDRRTVVDQATDLARKLQQNFGQDKLAVSTLRGQLADNHEWSADPSRPAIVIGTVDLIGSALLFSGYRSGYKRRPLEAGLLGQDSLLVLDEAHLSKPFEKLMTSIVTFQKSGGRPMQVVRMSATSAESSRDAPPFALELDGSGNLTGEDAQDETIAARFGANKRLTVRSVVDAQKLNSAMAGAAIELAKDQALVGKRIVVFVRKPDDARAIAKSIRNHRETKSSPEPFGDAVELLTGTMRGLERDELVDKAVFKERWLNGDLEPDDPANQRPVFLIATSAGEVGFDLNADHLVGDAAPLDSWIQRLGRVNRRGHGEATVVLVRDEAAAQTDTSKMSDFDKACIAASKWLTDGMDVSPKSLASLMKRLTPRETEAASSPTPATVDLTDILLDAWSMTSITESMPGRPEVGPWLRGLDKEQAQTTIAWRTEIELFRDHASPERVLEAIFIKHPIRPHESLTINTGVLLEFLKWIPKLKGRPRDLMSTRVAVRFSSGRIAWRTLQELADDDRILYAESTLILPATFGGLDSAGMLDADAIPQAQEDNRERRSWDVADRSGYERTDEARSRLRIVIERSENGSWKAKPLPGLSVPEDVNLDASYEKSATLFDNLKAAKCRVRLVQAIKVDDEGNPVESLVILASAPKKTNREDQTLAEHVGAVESEAKRIVDALNLEHDDPARIATLFAAKWHDEGKKALIWQIFAKNSNPDRPLGKMAQARDPKSLRGYRHEFGSLLRLQHPERCRTIACDLPADADARELALHLIAAHHGAGRPHFADAVYDPFTDAERDAVHVESIRRFARLQRKYGWWHLAWLENLLRCADQLASADQEVTEIDESDVAAQ
jgi:CRISPR-associated endonuclease/helicase Cas3